MRWLLIAIGWIALALGLLGAVLPLLPTTPFALLAAACFGRASARCHALLMATPVLGRALEDWQLRRGIATRTRWIALGMLWSGILPTLAFAYLALPLRIMLLAIAVTVTFVLLRLPTLPHARRLGTGATPRLRPVSAGRMARCSK